jgi:hypothetical protein
MMNAGGEGQDLLQCGFALSVLETRADRSVAARRRGAEKDAAGDAGDDIMKIGLQGLGAPAIGFSHDRS